MARMEVVDATGLVVNVIEIEPGAEWTPPEGCRLVEPGTGTFAADVVLPPREKIKTDALDVQRTDDIRQITDVFPTAKLKSTTIVLTTKYGSMAFQPKGEGVFHAITAVSAKFRGRGLGLAVVNACLGWMFTEGGATIIHGSVDPNNVEALRVLDAAHGSELIQDPVSGQWIVRATVERWKQETA